MRAAVPPSPPPFFSLNPQRARRECVTFRNGSPCVGKRLVAERLVAGGRGPFATGLRASPLTQSAIGVCSMLAACFAILHARLSGSLRLTFDSLVARRHWRCRHLAPLTLLVVDRGSREECRQLSTPSVRSSHSGTSALLALAAGHAPTQAQLAPRWPAVASRCELPCNRVCSYRQPPARHCGRLCSLHAGQSVAITCCAFVNVAALPSGRSSHACCHGDWRTIHWWLALKFILRH